MTSNYTNPLLSTVELAAVLAGLRLVQRRADGILPLPTEADNAISNILTNGDQTPALTADQIDELCELLNTPQTEASVPRGTALPTVSLALPVTPQMVDSILCGVIESGMDEWFQWSGIIQYPDPELPNIPCYQSAMCTEWDGDEGETIGEAKLIDAAAIATAIQKILSGKIQISSSMAGYIASAIREDDPGQIDADAADCIVQVAMFDELRYG